MDLIGLLEELEPRIRAVAMRTRRWGRDAADVEDTCQHLREVVIRDAMRYREASPALRNCMLRAAAISRLRAERRGDWVEPIGDATSESLDETVENSAVEEVLRGTQALDKVCLALSDLSSNELRAFIDKVDGICSRATADALGVKEETVRYYRTRIVEKLADAAGEGSFEDVRALMDVLHGDLDGIPPSGPSGDESLIETAPYPASGESSTQERRSSNPPSEEVSEKN